MTLFRSVVFGSEGVNSGVKRDRFPLSSGATCVGTAVEKSWQYRWCGDRKEHFYSLLLEESLCP